MLTERELTIYKYLMDTMLILDNHVQNPCCLGGEWRKCPIHSIYVYYCMARHIMQHQEMCRHCSVFFGFISDIFLIVGTIR